MSCNLTDKEKTLENLIRLSVICSREAWIIIHAWGSTRALLFHAQATRPQVSSRYPSKTRRLWTERDLRTRLIDDVTKENTEDDWERLYVSAADQSEGRLLQTLRSFRSAPRLLQTVTMGDFFCFRKQTTYCKYQKVKNYGKLHDLLT